MRDALPEPALPAGVSPETTRVHLDKLLAQLPDGTLPDAFVMGVGTGGTLIGVGQAFRDANPAVKIVGLEPSESCTILCGDTGLHKIEGIADGFVPGIYQRHRGIVSRVVDVHSDDAVSEMRRLASEHGMLVGPSSGANMVAARRLRDERPDDVVVTIMCDEGEKYLSEYFTPDVQPVSLDDLTLRSQ